MGILPVSRIGSALRAGEDVGLAPRDAAEYAGLFEHAG